MLLINYSIEFLRHSAKEDPKIGMANFLTSSMQFYRIVLP